MTTAPTRVEGKDSLKKNRRLVLVALALASPLALTSPASAGLLVDSASAANCKTQTLAQPFKPWLDYFQYTLVPGGNFESGARGWSLSGASIIKDNEPFYVGSAKDSRGLSLGSSGAATSAPVCVSVDYPVMRMFVRNRGTLTSLLAVDVLFEDAAGAVRTLQIGVVAGSSSWNPTLPVPVVANLLALLPDERTAIAFRFRATGSGGDWRIDDVYVDPHRRG